MRANEDSGLARALVLAALVLTVECVTIFAYDAMRRGIPSFIVPLLLAECEQ
jgi:hypothetical protein